MTPPPGTPLPVLDPAAPATAPARALAPATTVVLALLTAIAPLATDMYLPAFPRMATELGTSATAVQLSLTTFMVGLALGQLVIGPLSDQRGRRGLLIAGSAVCALAGVACALAPSVGVLIAARFVQGFSGAAGVVLARAVVSDRARGTAAAKLFGVMMLIQGVAPVLAPLLGGSLVTAVGWRGVFGILAAVSALMLVGVLALVPETLPRERRTGGGLATTLRDARTLLTNRRYLGWTGALVLGFAAMFAYISASPFVLQNILGLSVGQYSVAFAANALGLGVVAGLGTRLVDRYSPRRLLAVGVVAVAVLAVALLVDVVVLDLPRWPTLALLFLLVSALGLVFGNATTLATDEAAHAAGTGSALMGALQFGLGAAVSPLVGLRGEHDAVPMAITVAVLAVGAVVAARLAATSRAA
ncbi:multidrug effflux MFS transporter [Cellulomonas triticagri]|uniref:Bcr/CflA family efflux MFS transporter n=1 Tax=Cellulomonas triticagri TaxID=2483352 RepID=A0A3M2ISK8_9CELL|nr:multidrug effflux MFS transporter [Cellulomonas triticagri]RMI02861.1 Bcr/CflA family efflux MFS transporter [Cellulomonas triticagri]